MSESPLPMPRLQADTGKSALDKLMQDTVEGKTVPAVFQGFTTAQGPVYLECAGEIRFGEKASGPVNLDTTLQMFSMTKLVTTIACLQLLEQSRISLDDAALIEKHLPEISELRVLKGYDDKDEAIWEDQETKITLRMLLSHTSGMGYTFNSPQLVRWAAGSGIGLFLEAGATVKDLMYPLCAQPGTEWRYSIGIDWAGLLVSRITDQTLEEYFQKNIFKPCGMTSTTFFPTDDIKSRLMHMTYLDPASGEVKSYPDNFFAYQTFTRAAKPEDVGIHAGGAGLFGTVPDYLLMLQHILAASPNNPSPPESPLISKAMFIELFSDSIPSGTSRVNLYNMVGQNMGTAAGGEDGSGFGQSLGLCLNKFDSPLGRKTGSGSWGGAARTNFWIDPKTGLAGIWCTNIFAMDQTPVLKAFAAFERKLYDNLDKNDS